MSAGLWHGMRGSRWACPFPRGVVSPRGDVLQEAVHERAARAGHVRSSHARVRQRAPHARDREIVELVELLGRALPVGRKIRLVPDLEVPARDFRPAVTLHVVPRPLIDQLTPLFVALRRPAPAGGDQLVFESRPPQMLIWHTGRRSGHRLGHEADLEVRPDAAGEISVDDVVDDREVVDRIAVGGFGVDVGAAPLERGSTVTG